MSILLDVPRKEKKGEKKGGPAHSSSNKTPERGGRRKKGRAPFLPDHLLDEIGKRKEKEKKKRGKGYAAISSSYSPPHPTGEGKERERDISSRITGLSKGGKKKKKKKGRKGTCGERVDFIFHRTVGEREGTAIWVREVSKGQEGKKERNRHFGEYLSAHDVG